MSLSYLVDKIRAADFGHSPFRHIQINDFFSDDHFGAITAAPEFDVAGLNSDDQLFKTLFSNGYKIIDFPGCITNKAEYISWHKNKDQTHQTNTACEGFGVTLRLMAAKTPIIAELIEFMNGGAFQEALAQKFGINQGMVFYDAGIQKYLDGYEISPHPDIRKKALTYMVNVNPGPSSEARDHHTHYLRFREEFKYVRAYWEGNPTQDRCWVPWDWCESDKIQRENNSIVIFSPNNETMHAVKSRYDHLAAQRTQLYGNFWYHKVAIDGPAPQWEDFVIKANGSDSNRSLNNIAKAVIPEKVRVTLKRLLASKNGLDSGNVIQDRLKRD